MTDSRVVRRSTFIPTSRPKDDENECVIFDARLLDEKNVFANPIVTVINNGEDHVDGNVVKTNCSKKKQSKPIHPTNVHSIQIQTDDDSNNIEEVQYVNSMTQTEICCSWDDEVPVVDNDDKVKSYSDDNVVIEGSDT